MDLFGPPKCDKGIKQWWLTWTGSAVRLMASDSGAVETLGVTAFALSAKPTSAVEVARQRALQAADYYHRTVLSGLPDSPPPDDCLNGGADAVRVGVTPTSADAYYKQKLRAGFIELRNSYNEKIKTCRGPSATDPRAYRPPELYRSNSSLQLDQSTAVTSHRRNYGSTSSLDAMTAGEDSFFAMLKDYRSSENADQRAAGPPQMQQLLRGVTSQPAAARPADLNGSAVFPEDEAAESRGKKEQRKGRSTRGADAGILKRIRGAAKSDSCDELRRKAFVHYDCQSIGVSLAQVARRRADASSDTRNTTTGASAASGHHTDDDMSGGGCGESNQLLLSCPFFRSETGGEAERLICLTRSTAQRRVQQLLGDQAPHPALRPPHCSGAAVLDTSLPTSGVPIPALHSHRGLVLEYVDHGATYYRNFFHGLEHQNFFGIDDNLGPVAVSIKREKIVEEKDIKDGSYFQYRIIIRTPELTSLRGSILEEVIPTSTRLSNTRGLPTKEILEYVAPELNSSCLRQATLGAKTSDQISKVDEQGLTRNYKFGVMYCKAGQSTEEEMYNNKDASPAFDEFLECLGEKVRLKDFEQYRGGLDCKTDSTGTHSLWTKLHGHGIMFHVSTMLPFTPNNSQQLLRKRHIGNDIVTIVFQEPGSLPFTPKTVRSHFQHVFIIVRVHNPNTDHVQYSMAVSRSKDVPAFGPAIPKGALFKKSADFTEFLLTKAINAENAVHRSEKFTAMAARTRQEYLKDLAVNYSTTNYLDSGSKFGKFSLGSGRKKEKTKTRGVPDVLAKGALIWNVQADDFGRSSQLDCYLAIGGDTLVLIEVETDDVVFMCSCKSVIGWTAQTNSLRLYYDRGECVAMKTYPSEVDEVQEIVSRLTNVTSGCPTTEMTLRRNELGQLGFHIHYEGIISDVEKYGFAWHEGLRQGSRLVEICKVATATLTHDQMIDLLLTSVMVTVVVIAPFENGLPRRGESEPISWQQTSSIPCDPIPSSDNRYPILPTHHSQDSIGSRSSGQDDANERFGSDKKMRLAPEYEYGSGSWSGRVTIYPAYSRDGNQQTSSMSPRAPATSNSWYETQTPGSYLSSSSFTPITRKAISNNSLVAPHSLSLYQSDGAASDTSLHNEGFHASPRYGTGGGNAMMDGSNGDWSSSSWLQTGSAKRANNQSREFRDYSVRNGTDHLAESSTGAQNRHIGSQKGALTHERPKSRSKRTTTRAISDENLAGVGRCQQGAPVSRNRGGSSHRTLASGAQNEAHIPSTFQEDLMRLINPEYSPTSSGRSQLTTPRDPALQRTLSDESMCGSNKKNVLRRMDRLADQPAITSTPGELMACRPQAVPVTSTPAQRNGARNSPRTASDISLHGSSLRSDLSHGGSTNRSMVPDTSLLPMSDSAALDWNNLVDAARAFEVADRHTKSSNISTNPALSGGDLTSHSSSSQQSESSPARPPALPARTRLEPLPVSRTKSTGWQGSQSAMQRIQELEARLIHIEKELEREQQEKISLQEEVNQLQKDNVRLQHESQKAAAQLRTFTEWFFNTIDRQ